MAKEAVEKLVAQIAEQVLAGTDIEVVDVEYVKERDWHLRVYIDKAGGIEIEDCQQVSSMLEDKLDEIDPIKDSYYLEVSSPGLDRPLKREKDFIRYKGSKVELHTFAPIDGTKIFVGILKSREGGNTCLDIDGRETMFSNDKIAQVKLYLEF